MVPLNVWIKGKSSKAYMNDIFNSQKGWNIKMFEEAEYNCHNNHEIIQIDINMTVNYDKDRKDFFHMIENSSIVPMVHEPQYRENSHHFQSIPEQDEEESIYTYSKGKRKKKISYEEQKVIKEEIKATSREEQLAAEAKKTFEERFAFEYRRFAKHKAVEEKHATLNRLVSIEIERGKKYVNISNENWWKAARTVTGNKEMRDNVKNIYYDLIFP